MKGVIFDKDGILFDTESIYFECWKEAGRIQGIEFPDELCGKISGTNHDFQISFISHYYPDIDAEKMYQDKQVIVKKLFNVEIQEKPGLHEIMQYLHEHNYIMAVASGSPASQIEEQLKNADCLKYINAIVSGQDLERSKPYPDIFIKAAEQIGLKPEECYVFEDSLNGLKAAYVAGCRPVMIPDMIEPDEEFEEYTYAVCKDFFEAIKLIDSEN